MSMDGTQNIGEASRQSGVSVKMIRHYEEIGLLPRSRRSFGNYRLYGESDIHLLRFIKRARTLGFAMEDIKELVGLWRNRSRPSAAVKKIAGHHVNELKRKVSELQGMISTLENLAAHCHGDHRPECPILDDLSGLR